jgi:hypothetical protein
MAMAIAERVWPVSATEKLLGALLPSSSTGRLHVFRAPVRFRLGGGAAHVTRVRPAPHVEEPARVSNQPQRAQGPWPRGSWAFTDAARPALQSTRLRRTPCTSSSASGSPAPLTSPRETCAHRRPVGVVPCHRRHAPAAGPGESTLGPGRGFALSWSGTFGRRDGPGESAQPLPSRPTGERPCPSWPLRSRRVCQPILWHT